MPELTVDDVEEYTNGRLSGDEVERMLGASLAAARRHCGWHVSPVKVAHSMVIDGPGSRILWLPTMKVVALTSVEEDGVVRDVTPVTGDVTISVGEGPEMMRRVALRKRGGSWWSAEYGAIELVMSHGFTEVEAADWRQAILAMTDQMSMATAGASEANLSRKTVDDVTYQWANPYAAVAEEALGSVNGILCSYALAPLEYI